MTEEIKNTSYYQKVIEDIKNNRKRRLEGKLNSIPWNTFSKLSTKIPGIEQEHYTICSANAKCGKTQLCDFLYVLEPYKFIKANPNCGIRLKIFYFSLEVSRKKKLMAFLVNKIYNETGKILDIQNINSKFNTYILDEETEKLIEYYQPYFEEFEKTVTIVDNVRNPFGIYRYMRDYAESHGHYTTKILTYGPDKGKTVNDIYIANDPDEYVIVITDHISLLTPEMGMSLHQSISKFSSEYCLSLRDRYRYTIVNVQQQSASSEEQQFNNSGGSIIAKLKPSPDGLGDRPKSLILIRKCNLFFVVLYYGR